MEILSAATGLKITLAQDYSDETSCACHSFAVVGRCRQCNHTVMMLNSFYKHGASAGEDAEAEAAHLFLQRTLYRINRLVLFWYACCFCPIPCTLTT